MGLRNRIKRVCSLKTSPENTSYSQKWSRESLRKRPCGTHESILNSMSPSKYESHDYVDRPAAVSSSTFRRDLVQDGRSGVT